MNTIKLPPPPKQNASKVEEEQWRELLFRYIRPSLSFSGDSDFQIPAASTYHGIGALSAARTLTIPPSKDVPDGSVLIVQDEGGTTGAHAAVLAASAGDTVNGGASVSLNVNRGRKTLIKSGPGKWFAA